jgi:23S rRNA (uracil1939-C5)-methyltransferase
MDSTEGLLKLIDSSEKFDLIVIDPPRTGAAEVSRILPRIGAPHVIYISCDPPTLARDISTMQKSGYEVLHVQPVDMFPQTYHLESIAFMRSIN